MSAAILFIPNAPPSFKIKADKITQIQIPSYYYLYTVIFATPYTQIHIAQMH